jgi:hypothetical protein
MSPYKDKIEESVFGVVDSPPRVGGAISITAALYKNYQHFPENGILLMPFPSKSR